MAGHLPLFRYGYVGIDEADASGDNYFSEGGDITKQEFLYNIKTILKGFDKSRAYASYQKSTRLSVSGYSPNDVSYGVSEVWTALPFEYANYDTAEIKHSTALVEAEFMKLYGEVVIVDERITPYSTKPKKFSKKRVGIYEVHFATAKGVVTGKTYYKIMQIYYVA